MPFTYGKHYFEMSIMLNLVIYLMLQIMRGLAICFDYQWWTMYVVIISWLKQSHFFFDHHRWENLHIWWNYRTCLWNNVFCFHVIWDCNDDNKNLCVYFVLSVTTLAHRHTHKKKLLFFIICIHHIRYKRVGLFL